VGIHRRHLLNFFAVVKVKNFFRCSSLARLMLGKQHSPCLSDTHCYRTAIRTVRGGGASSFGRSTAAGCHS
jgi:hypothetical protein